MMQRAGSLTALAFLAEDQIPQRPSDDPLAPGRQQHGD